MDSSRGLVPVLYTLIILLLCYVERGLSIKCFLCNPSTNIHTPDYCEKLHTLPEEKKKDHLHDCDLIGTNMLGKNYTMCRKMYQDVGGDIRVLYSCASIGALGCIQRAGTYKIRTTNCHCDTDKCNGSNAIRAPFLATLVMTSLVALLKNLIFDRDV